jgi:carboxyl-terminal processing protease
MRNIAKNILWMTMGVGAGMFISYTLANSTPNQQSLPLQELRLLANIFAQIKKDYVEPTDDKKLLTDAIRGMVSGMDPHSDYLDKKEFAEMQEHTKGKFSGLGLEITSEDGYVKVLNPIEDTPAQKAGILSGDLITHIDAKPVRGMSLDQAVRRMRGQAGTQVTITVFRKSEEKTFPVTLTRADIKVKSIKTKTIEAGYAWVRINSFQEKTVEDLVTNLANISKENPKLKGIVLDLRNNGGGLLQGAIGVSGAFLPQNSVVVSTKGQMLDSNNIYTNNYKYYRNFDSSEDVMKKLPESIKKVPMVVLVNPYSASASEIVAAALQDHKRAVIMGKQSYGKGSVQTIAPLGDGTALKMTIAYYYSPSGKSIQAKGIIPDLKIDQNENGDTDDVYVTREIDNQKHLKNKQDNSEETQAAEDAREEKRISELRRIEDENAKKTPEEKDKEKKRKPPELGSNEDFMLKQAIMYLKGEKVKLSESKL